MISTDNKLSSFTDILSDEIPNSQPLSLSSSNDSQLTQKDNVNNLISRGSRPLKHSGQNGDFRSIEEIDAKYRHVFTHQYFNLVQSKVIEDALYSDKSMVVCAPTGSGKTVVFEMAIVQLLMEFEDKNYTDDYKIIYMAPVKALCTERLTEWYSKFTKLGLLCIEVTGDTDVDFPQLKPYRIIITTPEKWDMLTRRWKDYRSLVEEVKLFLIDEVHILNDEARGPVLEAVVSRMKTVESSAQSSHRIEQLQRQYEGCSSRHVKVPAPRIRFVAVSATVSNPEDVAEWLGTRDRPAVFYKFGDECRPVILKKVVEGYPCAPGASIFKFDIILNYKIWPIIQKYHNGKPTLIFCNTRKSVVLTAEALAREVSVTFTPEQSARLAALSSNIKTKKIQSLVTSGIGCHHAGLLYEERNAIEQAFRSRQLPILITTTTLAMGVNLPAHLVIIKNTQQYVNGAYQEYSISTILQMVGRAGRPQYDTEATAVIMTRSADKARYEALVGGCEPLQSYLHKRLAENLNSEAALSTVTDVAQCVQWLNSTFLSVRAARDPKRYLGLPHTAPLNHISKKIEELCVKAINGLSSAGLITMDEASCLQSTEAGRLMSVYYLDLETMKLIMKIEGSESLERLLWLVCESHEMSEMHLRVDERRCLNALNRSNATPTIRYPMKGKISSRQMKCNCVIQAVLGCLPISEPSLNQEATKVIRVAERVCKCLVAYITRPNLISQKPKYFSAILNALILAKCVTAHLWENSPYMSRQLRGIGPALSALLASAGKVNFMLLLESHPRDLERIMNKGPPAGNMLRKQVSLLPKYKIELTAAGDSIVKVQVVLVNQTLLAENVGHLTAGDNHKTYIVAGDTDNCLLYFSIFRDYDLISVYDGCITFEIIRLHHHEHKVTVHCVSSNFVGIDENNEYLFKSLIPHTNNKTEHIKDNIGQPKKVTCPMQIRKNLKRIHNNDISQYMQSKKRGNNMFETLNNFKVSLNKTSHDIKVNLDKTKETSHAILQDFLETAPDMSSNNKSKGDTVIASHNHKDYKEPDLRDSVDDSEISLLLKDIESEMNTAVRDESVTNKSMVDVISGNPINYVRADDGVYKKSKLDTFKKVAPKYNRKNSSNKNNFSFLELLENKYIGEKSCEETENNDGLSKIVKCEIDKFLVNNCSNVAKQNLAPNISLKDDDEKLINKNEQFSKSEKIENCITKDADYKNCDEETYKLRPDDTSLISNSNLDESNKNSKDWEISNICVDVSEINNKNIINSRDLNITAKENTLPEQANLTFNRNDHSFMANSVNKPCINSESLNVVTYPIKNPGDEQNLSLPNNNNDDIDHINKYTFTTSQLNIINRNNSEQRIQIVNRLNINFDVTEIVYNKYSKTTKADKNMYDSEDVDKQTVVITPQVLDLHNNENSNDISNKFAIDNKDLTTNNDTTKSISECVHKDNCGQDKTTNKKTIESIIQKYKLQTTQRSQIRDELPKPQCNNKKVPTHKPTRQYRISDLRNEETTPKTLFDHNKISCFTTEVFKNDQVAEIHNSGNIIRNANYNDDKCVQTEQLAYDFINSEDLDSSSTDCEETFSGAEDLLRDLTESKTNEIDYSMFNPQTLLQCYTGNSEEEVIPPPVEYMDIDSYSPVQSKISDVEIDDYNDSLSRDLELEGCKNIVQCSNMETWTLSQENNDYSYTSPSNERTMTTSTNTKFPNLSDFKYSGKLKLKTSNVLNKHKWGTDKNKKVFSSNYI